MIPKSGFGSKTVERGPKMVKKVAVIGENESKREQIEQKQELEVVKPGVKVKHCFTSRGCDPFSKFKYAKRDSIITNPDGSVVFRMENAEVPEAWSQLATDIVVSKYFRKRGVPETNHEVSVKQVVYRISHTLRTAGEARGYFTNIEDADAFEDELAYVFLAQMGAFNSPVWFNCGLYHQYGITGGGGNWCWSDEHNAVVQEKDSYSHPQCSACFIQSVQDDLMSIFDLVKNEARLFKYGSGTGTNFSTLRGKQEILSGGGTSSGLMSFLEVLDRGAGATKSGGTTRRAAKMAILDMDHPEISDFIMWKEKEELKARALIEAGYSSDFNGDAYKTVSGQNSNNSVRTTDDFMKAYLDDAEWKTIARTTGETVDTYQAKDLMKKIARATWMCADPGMQFDTTINTWNTCKNSGRINSSNPCSEYMFLDDSACNLASINLMKFYKPDTQEFDVEGFEHVCRLFILAQEIIVDFASYPTKVIAENSHKYRPLGLGYANMGTLLMVMGHPYDSDEARAICSAITAIMTATAYETSAEVSAVKGPFPAYEENKDVMLDVIKMHRDHAYKIDGELCSEYLANEAKNSWDRALAAGSAHGYKNSQVSLLAPTGTIGLLMDCDTTGIEPDFALVKFKKLAGGGYFKIINHSVPFALRTLGYSKKETDDIITYIKGKSSLNVAPHINSRTLRDKGFNDTDLAKVEKALPGVFELKYAFNPSALGEKALARFGFSKDQYEKPGFNLLKELGFSAKQIEEASVHICGHMTIEGAPYIKEEHLPVFDCANRCGKYGERYIAPMAHLKMMSAAQPYLSGAISKTVNLPNETTEEEIEKLYVESWKMGVKSVSLYRDGCKMSQPLNVKGDDEKKDFDKTQAMAAKPAPEPLAAGPSRKRLPKKRDGFTQEARVGGQKVYLRTGEYNDGSLGEIFVDMHKEGAAFRSMMNCFAIAISLGLQYGVPLEEYVDSFTFTRFEPQGVVDHPNIKISTSVVDYVFRVLGMEYLGRTDFVQVKPTRDDDVRMTFETDIKDKGVEAFLNIDEDDNLPDIISTRATSERVASAIGSLQAVSIASGVVVKMDAAKSARASDSVSAHLSNMMGDAPFCDQCGHVTVRNGACYRCVNCGNSMGCS